MKKIKVLQCVNSLGIGGNPIFVMNYFREIDREKFQVDFLIFDGTKLDFYQEVKSYGSRVFICPEKYSKSMLGQMKFVYSILKKYSYQVVHCHNCAFKGLLRGTLPAKLAGVNMVISHAHSVGTPKHTLPDKLLRCILKILLCWSVNYGLACSDVAGESKYTQKFMSSDKYSILHNAVSVDKFQFNEKIRKKIRHNLQIEGIVIGNVGRLAVEKNQKYLLDVVSYLLNNNKNVSLLIVGGGELEIELKERAENMGISDRVYFTGMVDNANEYYSAMDVYVMTSLYEGLPFTAVEAQVNGLKCVLADTITDMANISGDVEFLSLNETVELWAEKILVQSTGRSCQEQIERVLKNYNLKLEVKRLEMIYHNNK